MKNNKKVNREFTTEELIYLLKELNVYKDLDEKTLEQLDLLDGKLGNPDKQSTMYELTLFLLRLKVDIWDDDNIKIISKAVNDKVNINKKDSIDISFYKENISLDMYVRMFMLDLGLKPNLTGYEFFKDVVIYLLINDGEYLEWNTTIYPELGMKYNTNEKNIERCLRTIINSACFSHYNNDICKYVYRSKENITITKCLYLTVDYIKNNLEKSNISFELNASNYCYSGSDGASELNSSSITSSTELENEVENLLNTLGFSRVAGFIYLKEAILYSLINGSIINYLDITDYLVSLYGVDSNKIDRNLRYAIRKWKRDFSVIKCDKDTSDIVKFVHKYSRSYMPSELIALLIEYINLTVDKNILDEYKNQESKNIKVLRK